MEDYGTIIYAQMGYDTEQQLFLQAGWLLVSVTCNVFAVLIVDRMPRNVLITLGLIGCAAAVICEAALVATYIDTTNKSGLAACAAMLFVFVVAYALLLDGVTWWYTGEIFPTHLRAQGMTIGMATYAVTNIIWLQAAPTAFATIGWKYYLFFIIITATGAAIIYFTFPDTLNKPLEEVARLFGDADLLVAYSEHQHEHGKQIEAVAEVEDMDVQVVPKGVTPE
jgi:MFS family permease